MSRKRKKKVIKTDAPEVKNAWGVDAARLSPDRNFNLWTSLNPQQEVSDWARDRITRRARSLYANFPEVRAVVKEIVNLQGILTPFANTADKEWNKLARAAFMRRALNPQSFDAAGRLNFYQAQIWLETRAIIDGDALAVLTRSGLDGGAQVRFYSAPQISSPETPENGERNGVESYPNGRVKSYTIKDFISGNYKRIPAYAACLYGHDPSPLDPRYTSELIAAVTTAQDIYEINSFHKQQIKLASLFGIYEKKDINEKRSGIDDIIKARRGEPTSAQEPEAPLLIDGVKAISLMPGRELKTLHNTNPSNEVRTFVTERRDALALAFGLDPVMLFSPERMGGASARYTLSKTKDYADKRNIDRVIYCNRIWQHFIASEIAAGRLRPCNDTENAYSVNWINRAEWSIDLKHDINGFTALMQAGLASGNMWTLSHYGKTQEEVAEEQAETIASLKAIAAAHNIPVNALISALPGAEPLRLDEAPKATEKEQEEPTEPQAE